MSLLYLYSRITSQLSVAIPQLLKWWLVIDMAVLWTAGLWVSLCLYCEFPSVTTKSFITQFKAPFTNHVIASYVLYELWTQFLRSHHRHHIPVYQVTPLSTMKLKRRIQICIIASSFVASSLETLSSTLHTGTTFHPQVLVPTTKLQ